MKAWVYDDIPGDQREEHNSGIPVSFEELEKLGVIPRDNIGLDEVEKIAIERNYKNRDTVNISKEGLGDQYDAKLKVFFAEHLHEDEEIRYILDGSGYFDVRDSTDSKWYRIALGKNDFAVFPAGIYHRFTLDTNNYVKALRLFKDEPKWVALNRSAEQDANSYRKEYVQQRATGVF